MSRPVIIVDYDSRWPAIYEEEKRRILDVVGHKVLGMSILAAPLWLVSERSQSST